MKFRLSVTAVVTCFAASLSGFAATNSLQVLGTVALLSGGVPSGTATVINVTRSNQIGNVVAIGTDGSYATAEFHPFATIAADGDLIRVNITVNGYNVTTERNYNDLDENSVTLDVQVDDVPPVITGITEGAVTKENAILSFNEGTGVLNGSAFSSGETISSEGSHTLIVTDTTGNTSSVSLTIDKTPPVILGVADNAILNTSVSPTFTEGAATLNGNLFLSGTTVGVEGFYTLVVGDDAGNSAQVTFTLDFTAPAVAGVTNGVVTNSSFTPTFSDGTATLNGQSFLSGTQVSAEGLYTLAVTDAAGNSTMLTFTIDRTPPSVTGVSNNAVYRSSVAPIFNEGIGTLNGQPFVSGTYINIERTHTLVVTDGAGNSTTVVFVIRFPNPPAFQTLSSEVRSDSIVLRWTADADFFQIERSESGGTFLLQSSAVFGNEYTDSAITRGVSYTYRVTANRDGLTLSKEVSLTLSSPVSDVAIRDSGLVTTHGTITLEAAGSSGETATVTVGGDVFPMEESPAGSGDYVATVPVPDGLAEGVSELPATITIGNATQETTVSVTVDKTPPQPPVVEEPEPVSGGTLTLRMQAEPRSRVIADVSELAPDVGRVTLTEVSAGVFEANVPVEPTVSGERTVAITVTDQAGNVAVTEQSVTIQPEVVPLQFTLSLHTGVNLIYVPVKEDELERLSDLYSRLGGSTEVGSLIAINSAGRFVSFTSSVSTGLLVDVPLGDSAVIAVMKRAKEVTFTGEAPSAEVRLRQGINLVGVPRRRDGLRMSDIAAMSAGISIVIREDGGRFKSFPPSNAEARGGQGFIVVSREATTLFFDGEPWRNMPATAPSVSPLSYDGMTESELWSLLHALEGEATPVPPPTTTALPNYPNPFNPETWMPFQLSEESSVRVTIYALDGMVVRILDLGGLPAGSYENRARAAHWDGRNESGERVASGVYFYRLEMKEGSTTRRMLLLK